MARDAVSQAVARPVRGLAQMTPAYAIVLLVHAEFYTLSAEGFAAAVVVLGLIFSAIQNALEDRQGKGWFLRKVPEPDVPVEGA